MMDGFATACFAKTSIVRELALYLYVSRDVPPWTGAYAAPAIK